MAHTQLIVIPPNIASQLNRIIVLMGNLKSENKDKICLPEISGLLNALYKNQPID